RATMLPLNYGQVSQPSLSLLRKFRHDWVTRAKKAIIASTCAGESPVCLQVPLSGVLHIGYLLGRVRFRLLERLLQGSVKGFLAGNPCPLVTDYSLVVDHVERRRGRKVPSRRDRSRTRVARVDK